MEKLHSQILSKLVEKHEDLGGKQRREETDIYSTHSPSPYVSALYTV